MTRAKLCNSSNATNFDMVASLRKGKRKGHGLHVLGLTEGAKFGRYQAIISNNNWPLSPFFHFKIESNGF